MISFFIFSGTWAKGVLVEAESFADKGGWVVDQQFMDLMGSPYLMAHGLGRPVEDAFTDIEFPESGIYYVYVRTFNWTSPWSQGPGPGQFQILVDGKPTSPVVGSEGSEWQWQAAGKVNITTANAKISLHDLTGFNGRCDAVYFTKEQRDIPPSSKADLELFRKKARGSSFPKLAGKYDIVVAGGGIAGMCAAVSAARLGLQVALINDRPVWGGNNSSEIRVHLGGRIESEPYPNLGNLQKEFGPLRGGNAQPADFYEDGKKHDFLEAEKNITVFPNYRVLNVEKKDKKITVLTARHIESGEELYFMAPLFADCTGDGTVGYLAGAGYMMGREAKGEFNEPTAPEQADKMTMGASIQWYSADRGTESRFPEFHYGLDFNAESSQKVTMGEWTWETGMNFDQINDFERIRDYGLMVIFSNWSFLKNDYENNGDYKNRELDWAAYISGKRESRRLIGDHILTENDLRGYVEYEDGTAPTTWTIDLHYPDPDNTKYFPGQEFKSIARMHPIHPYPIPYRCLYTKDVDNLFMAGRNISVTHVALGTVRVMRTTGMMGEVVGMAAYLCKKHGIDPRGVYSQYLPELKALIGEGTGKKGLPNNQKYNEGESLGPKR